MSDEKYNDLFNKVGFLQTKLEKLEQQQKINELVLKRFIEWIRDYIYKTAISPPLMKEDLENFLRELEGQTITTENLAQKIIESQDDYGQYKYGFDDMEFPKKKAAGRPSDDKSGAFYTFKELKDRDNKLIAEFVSDLKDLKWRTFAKFFRYYYNHTISEGHTSLVRHIYLREIAKKIEKQFNLKKEKWEANLK